jgi:hypothetical protein
MRRISIKKLELTIKGRKMRSKEMISHFSTRQSFKFSDSASDKLTLISKSSIFD